MTLNTSLAAVRSAAPDISCEVEVDSLEQLDDILADLDAGRRPPVDLRVAEDAARTIGYQMEQIISDIGQYGTMLDRITTALLDDPGDSDLAYRDRQRQLFDLLPTGTIFHQIEHRQPVDQNEFRAHSLAHRPDGLDGEAHAVGEAAAPLVAAAVALGGVKLLD